MRSKEKLVQAKAHYEAELYVDYSLLFVDLTWPCKS